MSKTQQMGVFQRPVYEAMYPVQCTRHRAHRSQHPWIWMVLWILQIAFSCL